MKKLAVTLWCAIALFVLVSCGGTGTNGDTSAPASGSTKGEASGDEKGEASGGVKGAASGDAAGEKTDSANGETSGKNDNQEPVTITFKSLAWLKAEQEETKAKIDQWNKEHPEIQVKLVQGDWSNASQDLLASFETGDVPDIFHFAQPQVSDWKNLGFLADLRPMLTDEDIVDVNADVWAGLTSDSGAICGLPIQYEVDATFYNVDIFEKYNINPPTMENPWTFDEMVEVARFLQGKEGADFQGMSFPGLNNFGRVFPEVWATKIGDSLVYKNDDGQYYMKLGDESIAFIEKVKALLDEGIIQQSMLQLGDTALVEFLNGKSAMIVGFGCWYRTQFINESEGTAGINWGTAAPIKINSTSVYGYVQTLSIPEKSRHKEEAMEFLKWYWSSENTLDIAKAAYIMPGRNSAINDPSLSTSEYSWDMCQEAVSHNVIPQYASIPGWGQASEVAATIFGEYFTGNLSLEDFVQKYESEVTRILQENAA